VKLGRFHQIEVEDDVTAYLELPNGATGTFVSTTGEAPGTNRLEIVGSLGRLVLENDSLVLTKNSVSMLEQIKTASYGFSKPTTTTTVTQIPTPSDQHATLFQNFVDAIRSGTALLSPGVEGLHSIELANAMLYSGLTNQTVELPLDGAVYEAKLKELIQNSKRNKQTATVLSEDISKSFSR
jgi:predicted dehydrogenase